MQNWPAVPKQCIAQISCRRLAQPSLLHPQPSFKVAILLSEEARAVSSRNCIPSLIYHLMLKSAVSSALPKVAALFKYSDSS